MEKIVFAGWEKHEHVKGSLNCTAGTCNNKDGLYANITPLPCLCGGVIHGAWLPSSINDTFGPCDMFTCDNCGKEYSFDEAVGIKKTSEKK